MHRDMCLVKSVIHKVVKDINKQVQRKTPHLLLCDGSSLPGCAVGINNRIQSIRIENFSEYILYYV